MRKILSCIAVLVLLMLPVAARAEKGDATVGILGGFNTETKSALVGVLFQYQCNSWMRLSPDVQALMKKNDLSAFHINGNLHFLVPISSKMNFYPLAGLTYQSWKYSADEFNSNHFGLNAGAGLEMYATPTLKFMVEGKYSLVKDYSSGNFFVGISYVF